YGVGKGLAFQQSTGYSFNPAWNGGGAGSNNANYGGAPVFYNYKTESHQLNLDVMLSLGNILFHRSRTKVDPYVFGGIAANAYQTWINAYNDNFTTYNTLFQDVIDDYPTGIKYADRKDVKKKLRDGMDDSYETAAETDRTT